MKTFKMGRQWGRMGLGGLVLVVALLAAACDGTPTPTATPTVIVIISAATATATVAPTKPPAPSATATEADEPDEEPTDADATAVGTEALGDPTFICSMIHEDEAAAVLGQPVVSVTNGMDQDTAAGETINFCTWLGQGLAVVLSEVDTESPEAAAAVVAAEQAAAQTEDENATATLEPDATLGEQVYWTVAEHAAGYTVLTGAHVFSVVLGGSIGDPEAHKAALLALARLVAGRL